MQPLNDSVFVSLLLKHSSITLQGIGCFTLIETPGSTSRMGRDFNPPTMHIDFNPEEKADNLLQKYLAGNDPGNDNEAFEEVRNYIAGIRFQLEKHGAYSFAGLGTLNAMPDNQLSFTADLESQALTYGLPSFTGEVIAKTSTPSPTPKAKRRRRRVPVFLILFLLLIASGVTAWFVFPDQVKPLWDQIQSLYKRPETPVAVTQTVDTTATKPVEQDTVIADTARQDSSSNAEPAVNAPLKSFVIAGSFVDMAEATTFCNGLKQKGYADAVVLSSPAEGRIRVAYKGFPTKNEALEFLKQAKAAEGRSDIWVLNQN